MGETQGKCKTCVTQPQLKLIPRITPYSREAVAIRRTVKHGESPSKGQGAVLATIAVVNGVVDLFLHRRAAVLSIKVKREGCTCIAIDLGGKTVNFLYTA